LWENWKDVSRLSLLITTFLSIDDNTVYGFKYNNYKQLIHHVFYKFYDVYWILYEYMKQNNYIEKILSIDHKGTMLKDMNHYLKDKNYAKETKCNKMLMYLFDNLLLK